MRKRLARMDALKARMDALGPFFCSFNPGNNLLSLLMAVSLASRGAGAAIGASIRAIGASIRAT